MLDGLRHDPRACARHLFWAHYTLEQIAEVLDVAPGTVRSWKHRDRWEAIAPVGRAEEVMSAELIRLVLKGDAKTGKDVRDIDLLGRQLERFARIRRYEAPGGHEGDLNPRVEARNAGPKKKPRKNQITVAQAEQLREAFLARCFAYQLEWWEAGAERTRFILKSRQIGATDYFAHEALIDALETGRNQIFLSASRRQANIFRRYIVDFVFRTIGVKLTGEHLTIDRGDGPDGLPLEMPTLFFLGANYRTAQGEHGNFYYDECFWSQDFEQTDDVASGMASQKRYRETYFSTPSTVQHQAHRKWSGEKFNEGKAKADRVRVDLDEVLLKAGHRGGDGIWRQIVTIEDAAAKGCDLFDLDQLRTSKSPEVFDNLYMCRFIDDAQSAFPWAMMRRCMVDSEDAWPDFQPYALRPLGEKPVVIGYDPQQSLTGDEGSLAVLAMPEPKKGAIRALGKFRVLEKQRFRGRDYEEQAEAILDICSRYNVVGIAIDKTGLGDAVWKIVARKFANTRGLVYSVELKTLLVLKTKNVIRAGRLEFDAGMLDIVEAFVSIHAELTKSQRAVTYTSSRAGNVGHGDVAWAIMNGISFEDLDGGAPGQGNIVEIV